MKTLLASRGWVWAAIAAVGVLAAGIAGSVLGARAVAHNDGARARQTFAHSTTAIATTLRLAIQREEELTVSASTYFANHPKASHAEFAAWLRWARTLRRYPELDALGFLTRAQSSPALLLARDAAASVYTTVPSGRGPALAVETPVYRGSVTPRSVLGRRAASVGWLREVLVPQVMLEQVLRGHPGYALSLRHTTPDPVTTTNIVFASGAAQTGAQSATGSLHDGWSVSSYGPPAKAGVFENGNALALLIGGCLLSALAGLLVFVLGGARTTVWAQAPKSARKRSGAEAKEDRDPDLYDELTGLPNRALTLDRAERMVARAGRQSGMLAGALFIDVDWFERHQREARAGGRRSAAGDRRANGSRALCGRGTPWVASEETSSWCWSNRRPAGCGWTRWPGA